MDHALVQPANAFRSGGMVWGMMNRTRMGAGTNARLSAEELLAHAAWVRRLARTLVHDPSDAEDLVQETWLAAVIHPPATNRPLVPWLSEVTRNAFRMRRRAELRRAQREQTPGSAHSESPATPAELVERAHLQPMLVALVLELPESQRDVLLLRFFEDLTSGEIAKRLAVPEGTVRWRLKQGLEKLREKLDGTHGGDRNAWRAAVVSGFRLPERPRGISSPGPAPPKPIPHSTTWIATALVLAVVGGGLYWRHVRESQHPRLAQHAFRMRDRATPQLVDSLASAALKEALGSLAVAGRVVDKDGAPIPGAVVAVIRDARVTGLGPPRPIQIGTTGPAGDFRIEGLGAGDHVLTSAVAGHAPAHQLIHLADETLEGVVLRLGDDALEVSGTVEDVGGGVIPFASIESSVKNAVNASAVFVATADGEGRFRVGVPRRDVSLVARAHGYVAQEHHLQAGRRAAPAVVTFHLIPAGSISGRVVDEIDDGVAGAEVVFGHAGSRSFEEWAVATGADGRFEFNDLEPGEYVVRARAGGLAGKRLVPIAVFAATRAEGVLVKISEGLSMDGVVRDAGGRPFGPTVVTIAESEYATGRPVTQAGVDGRFRIEGLLPGRYALQAVKPGFRADADLVTVARGLAAPTAAIVMHRIAAGIRGRVVDAKGQPVAKANVEASWAVIKPQSFSSRSRTAISDAAGRFEIVDVNDGEVVVRARHPASDPAVGKATLILQPGAMGEVELRMAGSGGTVSGTVRWPDGKPASGVFIFAGGSSAITDARGAYRVGFFDGPGAGKILVSASRRNRWVVNPGSGASSQREVEVGPDRQVTGIDLVASLADMTISGVALAPDGKPVAAVVIEVKENFGPMPGVFMVSSSEAGSRATYALSGADGSWRIENLDSGVYDLSAAIPGSPPIRVRDVAAGATGVKLQFKAGARIEGVVTTTDGSATSGCQISTAFSSWRRIPEVPARDRTRNADAHFDWRRVKTFEMDEGSGAFVANGLEPGTHEIVAGCRVGGSGRLGGVVLQAGQSRRGLNVVIEEGITVSGQVVEDPDGRPIGGAQVSVSGTLNPIRDKTDAQGRFQLPDVARGNPLWLRVDIDGACMSPVERMVISPASGAPSWDTGVLRVFPPRGSCAETGVGIRSEAYVRGTFVDEVVAGSPAARAGISPGDRVVEIDGRDVSGLGPQAVDHWLSGAAGSKVSLTVWSVEQDRRRAITLVREEK